MSKKEKCELVKDILAMANTQGGHIVVGVKEKGVEFEFAGMSEEEAKSFKTTEINDFLKSYASPPINTTIKYEPEQNDKTKWFVIIHIPPFNDKPHICQKDFQEDKKGISRILSAATIYVRTDSNASEPLKNPSDTDIIIERAIRNRSDKLLSSFRKILIKGELLTTSTANSDNEKYQQHINEVIKRCDKKDSHKNKNYAYLETITYPAKFNSSRFKQHKLIEITNNAQDSFSGWPFIFSKQTLPLKVYNIPNGLEGFYDDSEDNVVDFIFHFWQFNETGLFYTKRILYEDSYSRLRKPNLAHGYLEFVRIPQLAATLVHYIIKLYDGYCNEDEPIILQFNLHNILHRVISSFDPCRMFDFAQYTCHNENITYNAQKPLIEWKAGIIDNALEICDYVFRMFNWDNPNLRESRIIIEDMLKRKY